jgi:hypothetical protein
MQHGFDLLVADTFDEPCLAHHRTSAGRMDLPGEPGEILQCLRSVGQHVHRVFEQGRAHAAQPAPHLDPQVVGLGRELMDEEEPAGLREWRA